MGGGIQTDGKKLQDLRFADDIILFATIAEKLGRDLQELTQQSKVAGLELNPQKTKLMTNSTEEPSKSTIQSCSTSMNTHIWAKQCHSINPHARKSNDAFPQHDPNSGASNLSSQVLHTA